MVNFNVYISESMILKVEDALKLFRRGSYSIIIRCAHEIDRPPELFARPTGGHPGGGRHCSQSSNLPIFQYSAKGVPLAQYSKITTQHPEEP